MSADVINLRQARKNRARASDEAKAAENRVAFGRTKAERQANKTEAALARRKLDSHKRDAADD